MNPAHLFTIGHSTHDMGAFAQLLMQHGVTAVADVRSVPASRFSPQFNREPLRRALAEAGVAYVFLGKELGARTDDPGCYEAGKVQYGRLAGTAAFRSGIGRLLEGADREVIAIMCTEKDPLDCHRTLLVARQLVDRGARIDHIHADGRIESHAEAMVRLRGVHAMGQDELFRNEDEVLAEALARQESRIAFVDEALLPEEPR